MGGCVCLSLTHCGEAFPVGGWLPAYPVVQTLATTHPDKLYAHLFHCIQLPLTSKSDFLSLFINRVPLSDDQINFQKYKETTNNEEHTWTR